MRTVAVQDLRDRHGHRNVATLQVGTRALVFSTRSGLMSGKLKLRWLGPFWITNTHAGTFQLGTLDGQILSAWVNGFRLKPYNGAVPSNPFTNNHPVEADSTIGLPSLDPPTTPIVATSGTVGLVFHDDCRKPCKILYLMNYFMFC